MLCELSRNSFTLVFWHMIPWGKSHDSSVSIVIRLWAGWLGF